MSDETPRELTEQEMASVERIVRSHLAADWADGLLHMARRGARAACEWTVNDDGLYRTGCGQTWYFDDAGTPADHKQRFCGYCGGTLAVLDALTGAGEEE